MCNVEENSASVGNLYSLKVNEFAKANGAKCLIISAVIEEEISKFENLEDINMFLNDLGLDEPGLHKIIRVGYRLLNLITFYTVRAEIISYNDYVNCGGEQASKEAGKMRVEGKTYIMNDSDIINVLFNI